MELTVEIPEVDEEIVLKKIKETMFKYDMIPVHEIVALCFRYGYQSFMMGHMEPHLEALQASKKLLKGT